ncbi:YqcC family protein [Microbulbifer spongiae]|uniref:YqcC family protein n=1 Tax=Microbulbifer spongiae TaxID=2944933 RepID=A0ABY9EBB3_9GAMM|nr:YqcC family protein [Microbulbifer sp. MI-G]WKD48739.1 YqcC family protein [Microbulbifer sp. MI-G]
MQPIYSDIASQLLLLEAELRRLGQWQVESPPAEALTSSEPFCVDTLTLPQWLQFVFLPRMQLLIKQEMPLPRQCGIAPIAEEFFRGNSDAATLVGILDSIDRRLQRS